MDRKKKKIRKYCAIFGCLYTDKYRNLTFFSLPKDVERYDHPDVIAGGGTVGLEILEQVPNVSAVLVPCGGGGLLAGVAIAVKHLRPDVLVYGVETEKCASMTGCLKAGKIVPYEITSTLADGLAVGNVGVNSFHNIKALVDKMVVVTEDWTSRAILRIVELEKYVVEGGGAVTTAAILSGLVPELKGKTVVAICSGGNIDTTLLSACLDRGLVAEQRMLKFKVNISSFPGSLQTLFKHLAKLGIPVKEATQERAWILGNIFNVRVKIVCETTGPAHVAELRKVLTHHYKELYFPKDTVGTSTRHRSLSDSLEKIHHHSEHHHSEHHHSEHHHNDHHHK